MKRILLAAAAATTLTLVSAADTQSISGQWKLHSDIQGHETDLECTLMQNAAEITGTCKGAGRELRMTGTLREKKVTLQYKTEYEGQELTIVHAGTLESSAKMAGSVDVQPMGVSGDFTATR